MARQQTKKLAAVTTGLARASGLPCATVLRLIRDLPGARALLPPSRATFVALHAWPQRREARTTRFRRPHRRCSSRITGRVHRIPASRVVTTARTPLCNRGGMGRYNHRFLKNGSKIFVRGGWTRGNKISMAASSELGLDYAPLSFPVVVARSPGSRVPRFSPSLPRRGCPYFLLNVGRLPSQRFYASPCETFPPPKEAPSLHI